jgi:iron complex transport system substrate-binding protein
MIKPLTHSLLVMVLWLSASCAAIADEPKRIVSLDLCTDWLLLKYASPSLHITYSPLLYQYPNNWLAAGQAVHDGSLEDILALQPELILSGQFNASLLRKRLSQLGYRVEVLPFPQRLDDINDLIRQFRQSLPTRDSLIQTRLPRHYPAIQQSLLLLGSNGIGTGRATLENDVLEAAGWQNYLQQNGFVRLDLEQLVSHPPDAVLWTQPATAALANLFAQHAALKDIAGAQSELAGSWRWQCPGPWTFQLIEELAQWKKH